MKCSEPIRASSKFAEILIGEVQFLRISLPGTWVNKRALQNLLVSRCYAHRHEQRTSIGRALGDHKTAVARRAAQPQWRQAPHRRPRGSYRHRFRPQERHTLGDAPPRDGLRIWIYLLAALARLAGGGRVGRAASGALGPARAGRPDRLGAGFFGLGKRAGQKGGQRTGPNPTDKAKAGSKRHVVSDRGGIPLAVVLSAANIHDSKVL